MKRNNFLLIMGNVAVLTIFLFSFVESWADQSTHCQQFDENPEVKKFLTAYIDEVAHPPIWGVHKTEATPIVLLNPADHPRCALFIQKGLVRELVVLSEVIGVTWFNLYFQGQGQADLERLTQKYKLNGLVLIDVNSGFSPENMPDPVGQGMEHFDFELVVHEIFHFAPQLKIFPSEQMFPDWWKIMDEANDRDKINPNCYTPSSEVEQLLSKELGALVGAFETVATNRNIARVHAREFLQLRKQRYAKVAKNLIETTQGTKITCKEAEAAMELIEGTAEFVGVATLLKNDLLQVKEYINRTMESSRSELFYKLGSLQMLTLFLDENHQAATTRISNSEDSSGSVTNEFARWVNTQ